MLQHGANLTRLAAADPPVVNGPISISDDGAVHIPTTIGFLSVTLYDFGARLKFGGDRLIDYGLVETPPPHPSTSISEADSTVTISAGAHRLTLDKTNLSLAFYKGDKLILRSATDGHFTRAYRMPPFAKTDNGWAVHFDLHSEDRVYGLGEKWGRLNKRGQYIYSRNEDALGVNAEISYKNTPFAWSTHGWGIFINTPSPVTHGVGFAAWSHRAYTMLVEDNHLDMFLFSGDTGKDLIEQYTSITGRAPVPPAWSLGAIISKAYYKDADELLETAREIRKRQMPCDTITLDGRAWQDTTTRFAFEWDASRYPDPKKVIDELKALNFKVCVWEYPLISEQNPLFAELEEKGWLLKDAKTGKAFRYHWDAEPFGKVLTPLPTSGLIDFTHPDAYAFWHDKHKDLFDIGVDMIKADFGEQVTDDMVAYNGETGHALHNIYAYLYNKCVYEAAERYAKAGPFLFSRSSWTGCQRFPSQWGGDPQADWEGLAASLRGGLSWGLSGGPYYATDVGGFYGDARDPKLYVRWLQSAVFSAHLRMHGIGPREPWSYGPAAEKAAMDALRLRYRLLPYLQTVINQAHETGLPVQRPMALACPDEPEAWSFENQFFFGDDILVAPCLNPNDTIKIYLPEGEWVRFLSDETYKGGDTYNFTLALDEMAVFVRRGATIPLGGDIQFVNDNNNTFDIAETWHAV